VNVPALSEEARTGQVVFDRLCASCHGANAAGGPAGPPLVHSIYRPAHHADVAFVLAVRRGVGAHHWRFGDMPPQPGLREDEIGLIVRYVRELQRANGID
jgi:mono/diheme cytochrome c family protein